MTFAHAAQAYMEFRNPSKFNQKLVERLCGEIGHIYLDEIRPHTLVAAANTLHSKQHSAAYKNRSVMTPGAAVLHYAAKQEWCKWLRIDKFPEPAPKTRFVTPSVEKSMHMGCRLKGTRWRVNKRLLLLWLFRQGDRISDALRVRYDDIDCDRMTVQRFISKSNRHVVLPLDPVISRYIKRQKLAGAEGRIFKWCDHHSANRWIARLAERQGVTFTAHMARHTVGKRLNDAGAGLKTIMQKLGQSDPQSAIRYQTTDIETIRRASEVLR